MVGERLDEGLRTARLKGRVAAFGAGIPTACPDPLFSDVPAPAPEDAASEAGAADTLASDAASAAHAADAPASYYLYSGSGELHIPFIARLFIPGLADYIPYYKRLVRVGRDSVAAPVARRYYAYRLFGGRVLHIQHALPREAFDAAATRRLLSEARRSWDSHRSAESGLSRRAASSLGCSRTRRCVWPT